MIVEVAIASATLAFVASLGFADRILTRQAKAETDPEIRARNFAERRRVLERDRAEWFSTLSSPKATDIDKRVATERIGGIDRTILALIEEEARGE